jgi:hypothetical protein
VTGGAKDGVDRVTVSLCEVVSFEMAILLEVADHRFDPTSSAYLSVHFSAHFSVHFSVHFWAHFSVHFWVHFWADGW